MTGTYCIAAAIELNCTHEAIALHIEDLKAHGQQVPDPHSGGELVSMGA